VTWISQEISPRALQLNRNRVLIFLLLAALLGGCQAVITPFRRTPPASTERTEGLQPKASSEEKESDSTATIQRTQSALRSAQVVLLMSFAWPEDPAAEGFEQAFLFALRQSGIQDRVQTVKASSPFETAMACDSLMPSGGPLLFVFVGDEGSAAVATLMSAEFHAPLLKITGDNRSYVEFSSYVYEFLPSGESQAEAMGEFAVRELNLEDMLLLTSRDAKGHALRDGFHDGIGSAGGAIEAEEDYDVNDSNIRAALSELFSNEKRMERGLPPLQSALTPEERTQMFGNPSAGDVLFGPPDEESADSEAAAVPDEGFFFELSSERVETFAAQLPTLPRGTNLLGNSSWLNEDALARHSALTENMYIVAPLLPHSTDSTGMLSEFEDSTQQEANAWELLGLDGGDFIVRVVNRKPESRSEMMRAIAASTPFEGKAVRVDFSDGRENRSARILQYENGELREIR